MSEPDLSRLPQIERLLARPELERWIRLLSRPLVARLAAETVAAFRQSLRGEAAPRPSLPASPDGVEQAVLQELETVCRRMARRRITRVVNATGVVLHTNLGRSPLAAEVWAAAEPLNTGYANLEFDLDTGKRGRRNGLVGELISLATGAEAALVVNNGAAALYLILACLARRREVLVSRGEQVQIGGGFRIPEILTLSGARLVEVGTTNVTTIEDYTEAVTLQTALVLRVHSSNFRIRGFTEKPPLDKLALALPKDVLLVVDQGSGALTTGIKGEERADLHIRQGAHLVCFSADKLLGGPQAGLIAGRRDLIAALARHPLYRVFRPGKTVVSLLEETLVRRLNGGLDSPAEQALAVPVEELQRRGRRLLRGLDPAQVRLVPAKAATGGGSSPDEEYPALALELAGEPQARLESLRAWETPIIGTIADGKTLLNLATVLPKEIPVLRAALEALLASPAPPGG